MIFDRIELFNYGPFLGQHVVPLAPCINGVDRPVTLIGGLNGAGKTSILDAFRLALYGSRAQCSSREDLSYDEYLRQSINIHAVGAKSASIKLVFRYSSHGASHEYRVLRSWTDVHGRVKESLFVTKDGEEDRRLSSSWDEQVESIIPLGISNLFFFDGEQVADLAKQEIPGEDVRDAIRSLLGFELIDRLNRDIDILMARERKDVSDPKVKGKIVELETKLEEETRQLEGWKSRKTDLEVQLVEARRKSEQAQERFVTEGGAAAESREEMERLKSHSKVKAETIEGQLRDIAAGAMPFLMVEGLLKQIQRHATDEVQHKVVGPFREELDRRDRVLFKEMKAAGVTEEIIQKLKSLATKENEKRFPAPLSSDQWIGVDARVLGQVGELIEGRLPESREMFFARTKDLEDAVSDMEKAEARLAVAASDDLLKVLQEQLAEARGQVVALEHLIQETVQRIGEVERAVQRIQSELSSVCAVNGDIFAAEALKGRILREGVSVKETLKAYQEKLCTQGVGRLEELVTDRFCHLLRKEDFVKRVKVDPETYALSVIDTEGNERPKRRLSAGERQMLAVALLWGLAEASGRKLPCVVDTPLARLDSTHRGHLLDLYFPHASHQMIILSTDTEFDEKNAKRLRGSGRVAREILLGFDKKKKSSVVSEGYFN